jgi:hypothetical protein
MKFGLANNKDSKKEPSIGRDRDSRRDGPNPVSKYTVGSKNILAKRKKVCDPWRWSSHRSINKALSRRMGRFALAKLWVKLGLPLYHASKGVSCEPIAQFPSLCLLGCCPGDLATAITTGSRVAHRDSGLDFWVALFAGLGGSDREWVD